MRMWLMYLLEMCKDTECSREGGGGECVGWSVRNANALSAVWRICRVGDQSKLWWNTLPLSVILKLKVNELYYQNECHAAKLRETETIKRSRSIQ
jgi:hypothetical protein